MDIDNQPAEHFSKMAEKAVLDGDLEHAQTLLKIAVMKSPENKQYQRQLDLLSSRLSDRSTPKRAASEMRDAALAAVRQDTEESGGRAKSSAVGIAKNRRIQLGIIVLLLLCSTLLWWLRSPKTINISPFAKVLSVTSAVKPDASTDLVLTTPHKSWMQIPQEQRKAKLGEIRTIANEMGFGRIIIYGDDGQRLATISPDILWMGP